VQSRADVRFTSKTCLGPQNSSAGLARNCALYVSTGHSWLPAGLEHLTAGGDRLGRYLREVRSALAALLRVALMASPPKTTFGGLIRGTFAVFLTCGPDGLWGSVDSSNLFVLIIVLVAALIVVAVAWREWGRWY
jgi:hypothetical protein